MSFDYSRLADPEFFAENRLPAHSAHRHYATEAEADAQESSLVQCLSGVWRFHYAPHLDAIPSDFADPRTDVSGWDKIAVPAHIQLHGYDRPQYVNVQYPWDGHEDIDPGQIPTRFNPVATYVHSFTPARPPQPGQRSVLRFDGAESAVAVWLNGHYIGFAADSFTPSEFDVTDFLTPGSNHLAVQVFKWTAGSWCEDQDFFRFSGLFRDVWLVTQPSAHVRDVRVTCQVSPSGQSATVTVRADATAGARLEGEILGVGPGEAGATGELTWQLVAPQLWSAEHPHLYELRLRVYDAAGELTEVVRQPVGVRQVALVDGLLRLNGQRLVFRGVNRHEFGLQGRVVNRAQTEADVQALKALGVNAVRTSHYPNSTDLYELCDEYGLYVIDEMNLESHGMWDAIRHAGADIDQAVPGDKPEWRAVLLDRAAAMLQRDKNHPSVVMWSCGNESFGGQVIADVADYFRSQDARPVHYEGIFWDRRHPATSDVESQMYTSAAGVEQFLAEHPDKPLILCEYAHAMGNSFGAVDRYWRLVERQPRFQGAFIWDFADQAVVCRTRTGREFFGYGGDSQEAPHDGDFCGNGIFFADHSPSPKVQEVKYLYQGLAVAVEPERVTITNRLAFTNAAAYECWVVLAQEDQRLAAERLVVDVPPGESISYPLPVAIPDAPGEYTVTVSFHLVAAEKWAPAGHEVAYGQGVFTVPTPTVEEPVRPRPEVVDGRHNIGVHGPTFSLLFSKLYGRLLSYRIGAGPEKRELLAGAPHANFWHAPTANERGWGAPGEDGQWLLASRYARPEPGSLTWSWQGERVRISQRYLLPSSPAGTCQISYTIDGGGRVEVQLDLEPGAGLAGPPEFSMLLPTGPEFTNLQWYGHGPAESYVDRCSGARLGVYSADVRGELTAYLKPQEAGNHTGVRWAQVTDDGGLGWRLEALAGQELEFSALAWSPFEVENAPHHHELPPVHRTWLRPAYRRRGVAGDDSWGARPHPEYLLPAGPLSFTFAFVGVLPTEG
ncbi:glycoside hydrolase family 2 TIM barrel-domain containing protein [Buchananella hordeovulneris]|uniref:Beta-galactosidase n=1 Tax=Buchananella hordeovulneris TaxID=52770 RepID=A0A1Q5PWR4_9ACTO|nr:glycoside hydrolase family 2 TIM barrel-domain containing protein [Buchananella hordeovulneris]OKL52038.1 beta-galactosidase [Buchananella hordeovulneris]